MTSFPLSRRRFLNNSAGVVASLASFGSFQILVRATLPFERLQTGNETIDRNRQVALDILQPTAAQVEHAAELHASSLVFDTYGFAPHAAIDADKINEAVNGGASSRELSNLREEISMTRMATDERERKEFFAAFEAAGVTCIFQNAGEEGNDPQRLINRLARFTYATDLLRPELSKAGSPDDIERTKREGKRCLYLTGNGVPLPQAWENVRDELGVIRIFKQLGIRMMHLTYNRRNPIGDGAGEPHDGGLSDFGHSVVLEMNRLGVIVDVAHSGWKTALEAAKASTKPMMASHTTAAGLFRHFRGKPDDTIAAICDTGGLVGICCVPRFLGGKGNISALLDHIDYVVKRFGIEHVAIGTDTSYVSRFEKEERAKIQRRADGSLPLGASPRWDHLWPRDDFQTTLEMDQSVAWTNWPLFTLGLVQRGYTDEAIRKIIGGNTLRVTRANFGS